MLLTHKDLDRAEAWFAKRGDSMVLFGRLIPLLRSLVSFAAGLWEMAIAKFVLFTAIGCALWCTVLTAVGYSLGSSYHQVLKAFSYAGYVRRSRGDERGHQPDGENHGRYADVDSRSVADQPRCEVPIALTGDRL